MNNNHPRHAPHPPVFALLTAMASLCVPGLLPLQILSGGLLGGGRRGAYGNDSGHRGSSSRCTCQW
jgi:hypothetical protein